MSPQKIKPLRGEIQVPADKSIAHRALLFSAFAEGETRIQCSTLGRDNLATLRIIQQLGVRTKAEMESALFELATEEQVGDLFVGSVGGSAITISGSGFSGIAAPKQELDCGNSGTTARLLCGVLAGRPFSVSLTGDASLRRRPFARVVRPLTTMGAHFSGEVLPFTVVGASAGALRGIVHRSEVASAQVKTALLLAGLQCGEDVTVIEPMQSRDHSERLLRAMGCEIFEQRSADGSGWQISLGSKRRLQALGDISIPGDFSAAAFFLVAASVVPGSEVVIRGVGLNPSRIGLLLLLRRMGAAIAVENTRQSGGEEVADLVVSGSRLRGIEVGGEEVLLAIDEIPVFACAAACAVGRTVIRGAAELRVKESDRLAMIAKQLGAFGVPVEEFSDGLSLDGVEIGSSAAAAKQHEVWRRSGDHRILMCGAILHYISSGEVELHDRAAVETSFPTFLECFRVLAGVR